MRMLQWLFGRKAAGALRRATAPVIEQIESRLMLAVSFSGGVLTVTGTTGDDTISISESGGTVSVTGAGSFGGVSEASVNEIQVSADAGNDTVTVEGSINSSIESFLNGDAGNDLLVAAGGNDSLECVRARAATAAMLLAGKPLLLLPMYLEQGLMAHAVCNIGAGAQAAAADAGAAVAGLQRFVSAFEAYAPAARRFAEKYAGHDAAQANERLLDHIERLVARVEKQKRQPARTAASA